MSESNPGWGHLADSEGFGRVGDRTEDYETIPYDAAVNNVENYTHASHGMIYARDDQVLWNLYSARGAILMQMRFDGLLGFPGGLIGRGEDPLVGLNRELEEEIGLDLDKHKFSADHHLVSYKCVKKSLFLHFFAKEVSLDEFKLIEMANLNAPDYGAETLGIVRPPLYIMGDGLRGLPMFLTNSFAGNSKQELIFALKHLKILEDKELSEALNSAENFLKNRVLLTSLLS